MFSLRVDDESELILVTTADADALFAVVWQSRGYLKRWLGWVENLTVDGYRDFLRQGVVRFGEGLGFYAAIRRDQQWVGAIELGIDSANQSASLGYWLAEASQGQGLMTRAARAVTRLAFTEYGLNRLEIRVADENRPSVAVAERLGFRLEGVLHQGEWVNARFHNLLCYGLLAADWRDIEAGR